MKQFGQITIILMMPLFLLLAYGCQQEGKPRPGLRAQQASSAAVHQPVKISEFTGEALLSGDQTEPDPSCRIAAVLDALRRYALQEQGYTEVAERDTIICKWQYNGISLYSETLKQRGLVVFDSISVDADNKRSKSWRVSNMQYSAGSTGAKLAWQILESELEKREMTPVRGYPIGTDIWQEVLQVRKWEEE